MGVSAHAGRRQVRVVRWAAAGVAMGGLLNGSLKLQAGEARDPRFRFSPGAEAAPPCRARGLVLWRWPDATTWRRCADELDPQKGGLAGASCQFLASE